MAASCADSMLAMFTASAPKIHVRNCVYVRGSKLLPSALRRLSATIAARFADVLLNTAWPFLLLQKPSVRPPPWPRHTLPNWTSFGRSWVVPATETLVTGFGVVEIQLVSIGVDSV